jgi:hypothetical protein
LIDFNIGLVFRNKHHDYPIYEERYGSIHIFYLLSSVGRCIMTRRRIRHREHDSRLSGLGPDEIDRLYGLEPVIDVDDAVTSNTDAVQHVVVACPYCGESFDTRIDLTAGSFEYVEDCQICCQPINLKVEISDAAELISVTTLQLNE